jgi:putative aldouronate transport system substrate-binding protein
LANKDASTQGAPDYWANGKAFTRLENLGPISEYIGTKGQTIKRVYIGDKVIATGSTVGALTCFSRTSTNVERAMEFFDRAATDSDLYNLIAFGIEGKHYQVLDANTNPKRIDFINGQNEDTVGYIHSGGAWSMGGNWFLSYLNKIEPANRNEMAEEFNKTAKTSALLGYSFDPAPVQNEIAACANVYSELAISLNTGAVDPDKYASQLVTKMKEAGADKIIAEKQKQIDQWKKDNNK